MASTSMAGRSSRRSSGCSAAGRRGGRCFCLHCRQRQCSPSCPGIWSSVRRFASNREDVFPQRLCVERLAPRFARPLVSPQSDKLEGPAFEKAGATPNHDPARASAARSNGSESTTSGGWSGPGWRASRCRSTSPSGRGLARAEGRVPRRSDHGRRRARRDKRRRAPYPLAASASLSWAVCGSGYRGG